MWRSKKRYRYGFHFNIKVTKRRESQRTARRSKGFYLVDEKSMRIFVPFFPPQLNVRQKTFFFGVQDDALSQSGK